MSPLVIDIHAIGALLSEVQDTLDRQVIQAGEPASGDPPARSLIYLWGLVDRLEERGSEELVEEALSELGDYAGQVLAYLASKAPGLGLTDRLTNPHRALASLSVWVARQGAWFTDLEPVTNAFAVLANQLRDTESLAALCGHMTEVIHAAHPTIRQDLDRTNPGRPWRILNLNRAIVATRSHKPALMDPVFQELVTNLPADASGFFAEGMGQMEALNYPEPVRVVMLRYYNAWCTKTLH